MWGQSVTIRGQDKDNIWRKERERREETDEMVKEIIEKT